MSFVKYEGLGKPNEVLAKIRDYIVQEGFTVVEDCVDDLDIFERNITDGKKLVFKDKTNNYFVCMRSMNGYQIFPEMAHGMANPEGKTLPTAQSSNFCGIGVIGSEGYSPTNRWYDQYLAPKKVNTNTTVGVGLKVAGESPTITILPSGYIPEEYWGVTKTGAVAHNLPATASNPVKCGYTLNYQGTAYVTNWEFYDISYPYTSNFSDRKIVEILDVNGQPASYNSDRENFNFDLDFYYDLTEYSIEANRIALAQQIGTLKGQGIYGDFDRMNFIVSMKIRDKKTNNIIGLLENGFVVLYEYGKITQVRIAYSSSSPYMDYKKDAFVLGVNKWVHELSAVNPKWYLYTNIPVSNLSSCGTFPANASFVRFHVRPFKLNIATTVSGNPYYGGSVGKSYKAEDLFLRTKTLDTIKASPTNSDVYGEWWTDYISREFGTLKPVQARIIGSNNTIDVKYLNPSTLYCNHITTPVDTLIFTLVDQVYGTHQHLVIGNVNKYANWEGGLYLSSSHNSYTMSSDVYNNKHNSNVLPTLSSTELGCTTFLRINVDEAPIKNKIYWASSGKPDKQDPKQCYTGKQLAMPIRYGEGVTGTWRAKIPHYGYLQSRSVNDAGVNCNTLNCITINLPLYMAVKVDPDSLNNFAPVGEVNGVYLVSMLNMGTGSLYEISYPNSGNLHQVFSMDRRRGNYFYDGIAITQEDNT